MDDVPIFPDTPAITVERTLALVKPDVIDHADQIVEEIKRKGFTVLQVSRLLKHSGTWFMYIMSVRAHLQLC